MRFVRTWHNDRAFRIQSLRVDLNGCQSVVTCVPIQQIALIGTKIIIVTTFLMQLLS